MTRVGKLVIRNDSTDFATRLWLDSTKSWLDSDSKKIQMTLTRRACDSTRLVTRQIWLVHITVCRCMYTTIFLASYRLSNTLHFDNLFLSRKFFMGWHFFDLVYCNSSNSSSHSCDFNYYSWLNSWTFL